MVRLPPIKSPISFQLLPTGEGHTQNWVIRGSPFNIHQLENHILKSLFLKLLHSFFQPPNKLLAGANSLFAHENKHTAGANKLFASENNHAAGTNKLFAGKNKNAAGTNKLFAHENKHAAVGDKLFAGKNHLFAGP